MRSLLRLTVYCISLVFLQQPLTRALRERPDKNRLDLLNKLINQGEDNGSGSGIQSDIAPPSSTSSQSPKQLIALLRHLPASRRRTVLLRTAWARPAEGSLIKEKMARVRRHAHTGLRGGHHHAHHPQVKRVGCLLGTCQVQNLSHRLYQLIGQSGREDSSPINPRSPHSYG
ncbi:ADM2 Intermedin Adrenomedullin-2 [Channa argus]|uniref:ADM2 Intermedin Adrenomedullin-2 n=1 Tax=Channa argus TaxID=215402 RepID=A0A6G1QQE3_CHAAH|nr:ADM2 Intermedin Adrenomedullin-2 [Channa argus]KAK2883283.1 hypothetical protein Q8A73_022216 [Channa argus]